MAVDTATESLRHLEIYSGEKKPNFLRAEIVDSEDLKSFASKAAGDRKRLVDKVGKRIRDICEKVVVLGPRRTLANYGDEVNASNPDGRLLVPCRSYGEHSKLLYAATSSQIRAFNSLENCISSYLRMPNKPLNIGIFGEPGSGKSYGPQRILEEIPELGSDNMKFTECNLATMSGPSEIAHYFLDASAVCGTGKIAVVLFDEFECMLDKEKYGWLKYLISPMQDGYYIHQDIKHHFRKAIFLFAGGTNRSLEEFVSKNMDKAQRDWNEEAKGKKVPDFISRLSTSISFGGINHTEDLRALPKTACFKSRLS